MNTIHVWSRYLKWNLYNFFKVFPPTSVLHLSKCTHDNIIIKSKQINCVWKITQCFYQLKNRDNFFFRKSINIIYRDNYFHVRFGHCANYFIFLLLHIIILLLHVISCLSDKRFSYCCNCRPCMWDKIDCI